MSGALVALLVAGAPVLTSADAWIVVSSPTTCEVTLALAVDGAADVEHRVEAFDGARIELLEVTNAQRVGEDRLEGRTKSLVLRPAQPSYSIRYRVEQPEGRRDRCPLWLPTAPSRGQSRTVRLAVDLPAGATPGGTMPGFTWAGTHGTATLGHLPAFVRVPYAGAGAAPPWDVSRVMDAVAMLTLVAGSVLWVRRRRG